MATTPKESTDDARAELQSWYLATSAGFARDGNPAGCDSEEAIRARLKARGAADAQRQAGQ